LGERGWTVHYRDLADTGKRTLFEELGRVLAKLRPERLVVVEPGEYRVLAGLQDICADVGIPLEVREDRHFLISRAEFSRWAGSRKTLLMETFYRFMRKRTGALMQGDQPEGGTWNYDAENRGAYPKAGPGAIPAPAWFEPDAVTREVLAEVAARFPDHPGSLEHFAWPVTREQGLAALKRFVGVRLAGFGRYQDAMWTTEPFGWHALLSVPLNLKLISPREVIDAALEAWRRQGLPMASVEGFVRQVLGWREFIRGVYWLDMPGLASANHLDHRRALPRWFWTGETRMNCMRATVGQTLEHGFAHHIQRLMVTGNFALLAGIAPRAVHEWYLAVYVDAVEWVELPNTAGMALYANGGRFTSKPYVASGAYVKRMSNYCEGCRYRPDVRHGQNACPMTTLYWNFLARHESMLRGNMRTALMVKNLDRLSDQERSAIRAHADTLLENLDDV
jgi:deoxyribodipyrimidine photolyase-related protein